LLERQAHAFGHKPLAWQLLQLAFRFDLSVLEPTNPQWVKTRKAQLEQIQR
jgi:hypothetical protein